MKNKNAIRQAITQVKKNSKVKTLSLQEQRKIKGGSGDSGGPMTWGG